MGENYFAYSIMSRVIAVNQSIDNRDKMSPLLQKEVTILVVRGSASGLQWRCKRL